MKMTENTSENFLNNGRYFIPKKCKATELLMKIFANNSTCYFFYAATFHKPSLAIFSFYCLSLNKTTVYLLPVSGLFFGLLLPTPPPSHHHHSHTW
jgi:hypothetical protein